MKRLLLMLAVFTAGLAGCINPHPFGSKESDRPDTAKAGAGQRPPTVYPHQVDDSNAHAMAQALEAEMEFDAQQEAVKSPAR
jgi:hypothetical protein